MEWYHIVVIVHLIMLALGGVFLSSCFSLIFRFSFLVLLIVALKAGEFFQ